jgi:hypothetical protein
MMNYIGAKKETSNPYVRDRISRAMDILKALPSLEEVFDRLPEFKEEKRDTLLKKLLAEICYLIAMEYKRSGDYEKVHEYAQISIDLYKECNISTLEDSVPILSESLLLPDYMHEGVVKTRLLAEDKERK